MGDRITLQFEDSHKHKSAILYSHWDGTDLTELALQYVKKMLKSLNSHDNATPLDRLEAGRVMFNFVWWLGEHNRADAINNDYVVYEDVCADSNYILGYADQDLISGNDNDHTVICLYGKKIHARIEPNE